MGSKILISILATFSFMGIAIADHHEGEDHSHHASADTNKSPMTIYGDFAASMSIQSNEGGGLGQPTTAGGAHDDFYIDLLEVNVEKNWSMSKFHFSLGYGSTPFRFVGFNQALPGNSNFLSPKATLNLMNAYYQWAHECGFSFIIGQYESPMGYESINHYDNSQYTRSWGFALIPYFLGGVGFQYGFGDMANFGFHVSNGSEGNDLDTNKHKTMMLTVDLKPVDQLAIDIRYMTGVDSPINGTNTGWDDYNATVIEASVAYMINDAFDLALDYTTRTTEGRGANLAESATANSLALYANGSFGMFGAGLRYEMFDYEAGSFTSFYNALQVEGTDTENKIGSLTLSAYGNIDQNAKVMLEYRMDSSDGKIWADKDGQQTDSLDVITASLMYRF